MGRECEAEVAALEALAALQVQKHELQVKSDAAKLKRDKLAASEGSGTGASAPAQEQLASSQSAVAELDAQIANAREVRAA